MDEDRQNENVAESALSETDKGSQLSTQETEEGSICSDRAVPVDSSPLFVIGQPGSSTRKKVHNPAARHTMARWESKVGPEERNIPMEIQDSENPSKRLRRQIAENSKIVAAIRESFTIKPRTAEPGDIPLPFNTRFVVVHFGSYCTTGSETYPAEFCVAEFSVEEGITGCYARLLDPREIPFGFRLEFHEAAKEKGYELPGFDPDVDYRLDCLNIIQQFADKYTDPITGTSIIYTMEAEIETVQRCLEFCSKKSGCPQMFVIYPFSRLVQILMIEARQHRKSGSKRPAFSEPQAIAMIKRTGLEYVPELACIYHSNPHKVDKIVFCSMSIVKRWIYNCLPTLADAYSCQQYAHNHFPKYAKEGFFTVVQPNAPDSEDTIAATGLAGSPAPSKPTLADIDDLVSLASSMSIFNDEEFCSTVDEEVARICAASTPEPGRGRHILVDSPSSYTSEANYAGPRRSNSLFDSIRVFHRSSGDALYNRRAAIVPELNTRKACLPMEKVAPKMELAACSQSARMSPRVQLATNVGMTGNVGDGDKVRRISTPSSNFTSISKRAHSFIKLDKKLMRALDECDKILEEGIAPNTKFVSTNHVFWDTHPGVRRMPTILKSISEEPYGVPLSREELTRIYDDLNPSNSGAACGVAARDLENELRVPMAEGYEVNEVLEEPFSDGYEVNQELEEHFGQAYEVVQELEEPFTEGYETDELEEQFFEAYEDVEVLEQPSAEGYETHEELEEQFAEAYEDVEVLEQPFDEGHEVDEEFEEALAEGYQADKELD